MSRKSIKFSFDNKRGRKLSGLLELPEEKPFFYGIFAPCFTCTKESHAAHKICRALAERHIGMLRFDPTGTGHSEGDSSAENFSTRILDIIAASEALAAEYEAPKFLMGHSISGTAALAATSYLPSLQIVATLGSPRDPRHIIDKLRKNKQIEIKGDIAELTIGGVKNIFRTSFVDDMLSHDIVAETAGYTKKLFIFHAPNDDVVGFDNARIIYDYAACDKELVPLKDTATHLLERSSEDAVFIANKIRAWAHDHLDKLNAP